MLTHVWWFTDFFISWNKRGLCVVLPFAMKCIATIAALAVTTLGLLAKEKEAAVPDATLDQVQWGEVVNDVEFDADALEGKVVVVEEWGVNCPPCIASLPDLAKLAKRYDDKGLVVVGLERQNSTAEDINKVLKDARVKYPVMKGGSAPVSTGGIPHACVFGVDGKLVWHGHPADKEFERALKAALREVAK
jgi:thiol-disulfide isomerase/thioredoxin